MASLMIRRLIDHARQQMGHGCGPAQFSRIGATIMPHKPRHHLSKRLSLSLGLLSTAIVMVVSIVVFVILTWRVGDMMRAQAEKTIVFLSQALEAPFWSLDRDSAVAVAQATAMDKSVAFIELRDARGESWFVHETGKTLFLLRETEVRHAGQTIGFIRLGLAEASRMRTVTDIALAGSGVALLVIVAQYFLASWLLRRSLNRPFRVLDTLVGAYSRGDYVQPDPDLDVEEFAPLVETLLDMGRTIHRQLEALRESEEKYRAIFDNSPVGIVRVAFDGSFVDGNKALGRMFGYDDVEDFLANGGASVLSSYVDPSVRQGFLARVLASDTGASLETELLRKDGSPLSVVITSSVQRDAAGQPLYLNSVIEDVSQRTQALLALRESEARFRTLFDAMPNGFYRSTPEGYFVDANPAFVDMLGYDSLEELKSVYIPTTIYVRESERVGILGHNAEFIDSFEHYRLRRKDGRIIWIEDNARYIKDAQNKVLFHEGICQDVTDRRTAEERLRQSEEKFAQLFRLSPDVVMLMRLEDGRILDVNEAFSRVTGHALADAVGKTAQELGLYDSISARETVRHLVELSGRIENHEFILRRRDGSFIDCMLSCQFINIEGERCVIAVLRDVTELKHMQEMMIQTEKMISVGGIAAGVAHEINNPLGIIMANSQNLVQRTRPDFPKNIEVAEAIGLDMALLDSYMGVRGIYGFVETIQTAALRAADIIRHMLDFSRRSESKRKVCELRAIVEKALALAENDYDLKKNYDFKKIRVTWECDATLSAIDCTETELEQVFLNLLRNSSQAMASARPEIPDPAIVVRLMNAGDHVVVELEDNGPGMTAEVQRRAFEPFFTTKPPGVGTGLGLSVSYFIVTRSHGGRMRLESSPGRGAKFIIELPVRKACREKEGACPEKS
jgi:PAS domain S-box-containing protein